MVRTETRILEKVFAQQFFRPGKSLEKGDEVGKNGKNLEFLFFQSYNKCFISEFFFRFGQLLFNIALTFDW